ncbi:MAG: hypothetical protein ACWGOX_12895 [Desulforhopalus sp.]
MKRSPLDSIGAARGNFATYSIGFLSSVLLTALSFLLVVKGGTLPRPVVFSTIILAAIA